MATKIEQITVAELYMMCQQQIKAGNGGKYIIVSDDNEGNGYHGMFFGLTPIKGETKGCIGEMISDSQVEDIDKLIILG